MRHPSSARSFDAMADPRAHRNVTHRDGSREGDADAEADRSAMKDTQRDLTSLSTPVIRDKKLDPE